MAGEKAEKVLRALEERDLSVAWVARRIGESRQAVHNWLKGVKAPSDPSVFDRMLDAIERGVVHEHRAVYGAARTSIEVPLSAVGSAGAWKNSEGRETVVLPAQLVADDYRAVLVDGASMLPFLLPGDIAIFREWHVPKVGFVNACSKDGDLMIKQVSLDGGRMVLRSFNPNEPDMPAEGVRALGYLVGVYRDDGVETSFRHNKGGLRFD